MVHMENFRSVPSTHEHSTKKYNTHTSTQYEKIPTARLGTLTPVAARIFFICCSTVDKFAAGLGQSVPFIKAGFHMPRVTSDEK